MRIADTVAPTPPDAANQSNFRLILLGGFQLIRTDGTRLLGAGKPLALLAYLACARRRRIARGVGAQLLWGGSAEQHSRASQRQALFSLRHHLGEHAILSDGDWIELAVPLEVDADAFVCAVEAQRYGDAVVQYTGAFVPAFAAPGAADFEQWVEAERLRLSGTYHAAAVHHMRELMNCGDVAAALELSKRLVAETPDDDGLWRQRFEILALARQPGELLLEIATFRAMCEHEGRRIDPSLDRFMAQLEAAGASKRSAEPVRQPDHELATPAFQGRADVFSALLAAWSCAASSAPQRLLIVGAAGIGKSRLLDEFAHRLHMQRCRAIRVSARQNERDDPFSLLADLVVRLADRPGAGGISPSSVALLAGIAPTLADRFSVTQLRQDARDLHGPDVAVPMAQALADLVTAVAEESALQGPLVVLMDDLHWADARSVQVMERAFARVSGVPIVLVCASRFAIPRRELWSASHTLMPLTFADVQALMASVAMLDNTAEFTHIVAELHEASGGVPFTALRLLHEVMETGALRIADGRWAVTDVERFGAVIRRTKEPAGRLDGVDRIDRKLLCALALVERPLAVDVLSRVGEVAGAAVTQRLMGLERRGLVMRSGDLQWSSAHALVSDDLLSVMPSAEVRVVSQVLGDWCAQHVPDLAALRRAVRLQIRGGALDAARMLAVRWYSAQRNMAYGLDGYVDALSGAGGDAAFMTSLRRSLYWRRRWWSTAPAVAGFSLLFSVLAASVILLQPVRLVSTGLVDPASDLDPGSPYEVAPRFELLNRLGRVSRRRDGDSVRVGRWESAEPLRGQTYAVIKGGVAVFDSLYPPTLGAGDSIRVTLSGVSPLGIGASLRQELLTLESAVFNGESYAGAAQGLQVRPGERIEGVVRFRYSTVMRGALYVLAQTSTWQDPQRDTITVRSLLAGVSDARSAHRVSVRAPVKPGSYWMLWTHQAEPTAVWLLSGTNWRCGRPVWGDGNDLAAQDNAVLAEAVRSGALTLPVHYCGRHLVDSRPTVTPFTERVRFPVAGVRVEVR